MGVEPRLGYPHTYPRSGDTPSRRKPLDAQWFCRCLAVLRPSRLRSVYARSRGLRLRAASEAVLAENLPHRSRETRVHRRNC